jgi:hypothetical protein
MKRNKYFAKKVGGFDSKGECARYHTLKLLERAGEISNLEKQKPFTLQEKFRRNNKAVREIKLIADFVYEEDGKDICEDYKGSKFTKTSSYELKKKLFLCRYPDITFREVVGTKITDY